MSGAGRTVLRFAARARVPKPTASFAKTRAFHASQRRDVVKPFLLADIGEGIKEVQIIQWFVQPGARVEQFDKICEVQSDKASVDISSRFDGVIKKLHYEADAMAQVGKPLCDIDIQGDISAEDEKMIAPEGQEASGKSEDTPKKTTKAAEDSGADQASPKSQVEKPANANGSLATPAVRNLLKELKVKIEDVNGTGKDGRVLKEDVQRFAEDRDKPSTQSPQHQPSPAISQAAQQEETVSLTPIQSAMFKSMTKSLSIPHFLYADEVDFTNLSALRTKLNALAAKSASPPHPKLSYLPFIIKAISIALHDYPILNARLNLPASADSSQPPTITTRPQHNIGIAIDTPAGLVVPSIKDAGALSVAQIAAETARLHAAALAGKLSRADLAGGTFTVSNIGSVGGTYASPVLVEGQLGIVAVGRCRDVPAFDGEGRVVKRVRGAMSWCADHRVVDGATVARVGERVRGVLEEPGLMAVGLK